MKHEHAGISCCVTQSFLCAAIQTVLESIRRRAPRDLARVQARVACFQQLKAEDCADGTSGQFRPLPARQIRHPKYGILIAEDDDQRQGVIELAADAEVGTVAHEFGHAVATDADCARRQAPDDEWANELAADYYAYKWGFGRAIARTRPSRRFGHHCVGPDHKVGLGEDWYRVSRRFVMHRTSPPEWWTASQVSPKSSPTTQP